MNVIAYAVFANPNDKAGTIRQFYSGMMKSVVRAHHFCFPSWKMIVYHDDVAAAAEFFKIWQVYESAGLLQLRNVGPARRLCAAMLWRLRPLFDEGVERVLCRDLDALPSPREAEAVGDWITTGESANVIHDSVSHAGLMGGTTGFVASAFREKTGLKSIEQVYAACADLGITLENHGDDQHFLNRFVAPRLDVRTQNLRAIPKHHPLDVVGWHVGGAQHQELAMVYFKSLGTFRDFDAIDGGLGRE